jgi:pilus assembly protein CpaF
VNTTSRDKAAATWARIIPFLRPIEALINDPDVTDIMVNGDSAVFFEKHGRLQCLAGVTVQETALQVAARNIARSLGDDISEESPLRDSRLPDGSRIAMVLAPVSVGGTSLSIRKFQSKRYDAEELVRVGTMTAAVLRELKSAVLARKNILISGGTGTGKTTLLNALASFIPDDERLVLIEDTSEIQINQPNLVRLEARQSQPDLPAVTIQQLLRIALRMRPDRILLGEVRGAEGFDLLQALNTGHQGSLSTIHANSAGQTMARLATCVMMAGIELPHGTVRENIGDALDLVVHIERREGKRSISEVLRVVDYDTGSNRFELESLYRNSAGLEAE